MRDEHQASLLVDLLSMQDALLAPDTTLDRVMQIVCDRAIALTGAEGSTIEMQEDDELVYRAAAGTTTPFAGTRLKAATSLSGLAVRARQVLVCDDSEKDERVDREACRRVGARSMIIVPLFHQGASVGVLKVSSNQPHAFDGRIADLLRMLAGFVATAIARAEAHDAREAHRSAERARVRELERLRDELSSLVVHDLRSPLASISANLEFLKDELPAGAVHALEAALDALEATKRLDALVRMLLDMSRLEQRQLKLARAQVSAIQLVERIIAERERQARERRIVLRRRVDADAQVFADTTFLMRALDNVIDNALRFTPPGGTIELAVVERGELTEIRVGNDGPEIPEADRTRIFEKFAQSKRVGAQNFGLGLYFCRLVLEAHGGAVWVASEPALPTVFVMAIPKTDAA